MSSKRVKLLLLQSLLFLLLSVSLNFVQSNVRVLSTETLVGSNSNENQQIDDNTETPIRTATGGLIYQLMVTLTVIAFLANGAFLIYVFWLSK